LIQTNDGGYALAGVKGDYEEGDFWLVKTDVAGNMQWNYTSGGSKHDIAYSIIQLSDGGYAFAGYTDSEPGGPYSRDAHLAIVAVESGLAWVDSAADTIILYRGLTDAYWNYVRVRIWKIKDSS
jgi:hypothetical protein